MIAAGNFAENNAGPVLYIGDIAIPLIILSLLLARWKLQAPTMTATERA
jgi:hypothetical protein